MRLAVENKDEEVGKLNDTVTVLSNRYNLLLSEKDGLREKYDTDISLLKEAMLDMQQLLRNPEKLAEISRAAKPEIPR